MAKQQFAAVDGKLVEETVVTDANLRVTFVSTNGDSKHLRVGTGAGYAGAPLRKGAEEVNSNDFAAALAAQAEAFTATRAQIEQGIRAQSAQQRQDAKDGLLKIFESMNVPLTESQRNAVLAFVK